MFKATIYHWYIQQNAEYYIVYGFTGDKPTFANTIRTSYIELLNLKDGWVKTRNSFYKLEQQRIDI